MEMNQILPRIRRMQKDNRWSSSQLAQRSGVPQTTISSLYRRNNVPTIPTLAMMCNAFGLTLSQFFNEYDSIDCLSPDQRELLKIWDELTEGQKDSILELIRSIVVRGNDGDIA